MPNQVNSGNRVTATYLQDANSTKQESSPRNATHGNVCHYIRYVGITTSLSFSRARLGLVFMQCTPIANSSISILAPKYWSLRVLYQLPSGPFCQNVIGGGVGWIQDRPVCSGVPLSPLASVSWEDGKEVGNLSPTMSRTESDRFVGRSACIT